VPDIRTNADVSTSRGCSARTCKTGRLTTAFSRFICPNAGLSSTRSRTYNPMATRTMLARNGTRQPQVSNEGPATELNSLTMPVDSSSPTGTPTCGQLAMKPRQRCLPHSIDSSTEPPHSPPTPMPCRTRRTTSRKAAVTPSVAALGSTPIRAVAMPISSSVAIRVPLRPIRSP